MVKNVPWPYHKACKGTFNQEKSKTIREVKRFSRDGIDDPTFFVGDENKIKECERQCGNRRRRRLLQGPSEKQREEIRKRNEEEANKNRVKNCKAACP